MTSPRKERGAWIKVVAHRHLASNHMSYFGLILSGYFFQFFTAYLAEFLRSRIVLLRQNCCASQHMRPPLQCRSACYIEDLCHSKVGKRVSRLVVRRYFDSVERQDGGRISVLYSASDHVGDCGNFPNLFTRMVSVNSMVAVPTSSQEKQSEHISMYSTQS